MFLQCLRLYLQSFTKFQSSSYHLHIILISFLFFPNVSSCVPHDVEDGLCSKISSAHGQSALFSQALMAAFSWHISSIFFKTSWEIQFVQPLNSVIEFWLRGCPKDPKVSSSILISCSHPSNSHNRNVRQHISSFGVQHMQARKKQQHFGLRVFTNLNEPCNKG